MSEILKLRTVSFFIRPQDRGREKYIEKIMEWKSVCIGVEDIYSISHRLTVSINMVSMSHKTRSKTLDLRKRKWTNVPSMFLHRNCFNILSSYLSLFDFFYTSQTYLIVFCTQVIELVYEFYFHSTACDHDVSFHISYINLISDKWRFLTYFQ